MGRALGERKGNGRLLRRGYVGSEDGGHRDVSRWVLANSNYTVSRLVRVWGGISVQCS